jgi:hypothetical protein
LSHARVGDLFVARQVQIGQLLKLGHLLEARIGDLGFPQVKPGELLKLGHPLETRAGDLGFPQVKPGELLKLGHPLETRAGDLGFPQVKPGKLLKLGHPLETRAGDFRGQAKRDKLLMLGHLLKARVGDLLAAGQVKRSELLELGHLLEARIGDFGTPQVNLRHLLQVRLGEFAFGFLEDSTNLLLNDGVDNVGGNCFGRLWILFLCLGVGNERLLPTPSKTHPQSQQSYQCGSHAATLPPPQAGASVGGLKTDAIKTNFPPQNKGYIYIYAELMGDGTPRGGGKKLGVF